MKNTVKDLVSILRGHSHGAEHHPDPAQILKPLESDYAPDYWKDWRWQVRHVVRDIDTVQQVLGIAFRP